MQQLYFTVGLAIKILRLSDKYNIGEVRQKIIVNTWRRAHGPPQRGNNMTKGGAYFKLGQSTIK